MVSLGLAGSSVPGRMVRLGGGQLLFFVSFGVGRRVRRLACLNWSLEGAVGTAGESIYVADWEYWLVQKRHIFALKRARSQGLPNWVSHRAPSVQQTN